MVGRQAVHRRRHPVLDRRLRQEHRAVQVAALRDRHRRQGLQRREDQRDDRQVHLRQLLRAVPGADGDAARPVSDAVRQALLRAIPSQIQRERRRPGEAGEHVELDRPVPRQVRRRRDSGALGQCRQADARAVGDHRALCRRRDARGDEAQSVLLAGRHRRQSTALYRPDHLQHLAGRRIADARCDLGQDRLPGPPHRLAAEQADAGAERAEGRLPAGRAGVLALQPVPDLLQHHPQRPEDAGDVRQQGFPQGAVARHQPQGDRRHRLSRPVRAVPGRAAPGPSLVPREIRPAVHRPQRQGGERHPRRARLQARRAGRAPAAGRAEGVLRHRRDPDALSGPGRHARAGEASLGRARRRHEGQHAGARALLHARRQQRP